MVRILPQLNFHLEWAESPALCSSRRRNHEVSSRQEEVFGHCPRGKKLLSVQISTFDIWQNHIDLYKKCLAMPSFLNVTILSSMWSFSPPCDPSLLHVTLLSSMWQFSHPCDYSLLNVNIFSSMWPFSLQCDPSLLNVTILSSMWPFSPPCDHSLLNVNIFSSVWPFSPQCDRSLLRVTILSSMWTFSPQCDHTGDSHVQKYRELAVLLSLRKAKPEDGFEPLTIGSASNCFSLSYPHNMHYLERKKLWRRNAFKYTWNIWKNNILYFKSCLSRDSKIYQRILR